MIFFEIKLFWKFSWKIEKIYKKSKIYVVFEVSAVLKVFPSERAQKMLKFGVLDALKFDDTAENEPKQIPKSAKFWVYYA